jgi:hypothetical protein
MPNPSVLAILARTGGRTEAMLYCIKMARDYPALRYEYTQYLDILTNMKGSHDTRRAG